MIRSWMWNIVGWWWPFKDSLYKPTCIDLCAYLYVSPLLRRSPGAFLGAMNSTASLTRPLAPRVALRGSRSRAVLDSVLGTVLTPSGL